jgi:hypothetical protein
MIADCLRAFIACDLAEMDDERYGRKMMRLLHAARIYASSRPPQPPLTQRLTERIQSHGYQDKPHARIKVPLPRTTRRYATLTISMRAFAASFRRYYYLLKDAWRLISDSRHHTVIVILRLFRQHLQQGFAVLFHCHHAHAWCTISACPASPSPQRLSDAM